MLPNHPNQLLQTTLDKLSHELHANMDNYLLQMKAEQQALINDTLSQLIPTLLTKLTPIIEQEVKNQNQPMLTQVEACLNELKTTNQQQLKMLKSGREEYQGLQTKIQSALSQLDSIQSTDDSEIEKLLTHLQTQITTLANSQQSMTSKQTDLSNSISELEKLQAAMATTLSDFTTQQTNLNQALALFQTLLKP